MIDEKEAWITVEDGAGGGVLVDEELGAISMPGLVSRWEHGLSHGERQPSGSMHADAQRPSRGDPGRSFVASGLIHCSLDADDLDYADSERNRLILRRLRLPETFICKSLEGLCLSKLKVKNVRTRLSS